MKQRNNEQLSRLWRTASNLLPPIGIIIYLKYRKRSPVKTAAALKYALIGLPGAVVGGYVFQNYILN